MTNPPPTVITRTVRYQSDGGTLLTYLAAAGLVAATGPAPGSRPVDTVLLESVDIATKASRTTIAVLESSTRLTCQGQEVILEALPQARADGEAALERVRASLAEHVTARSPGVLRLMIPSAPDDGTLEERQRLTALSTIEPLRVLAAADVDHPHLPLEAGVVAFDYLATFETLPAVAMGANTCPDYLLYDARIILVIDHPTTEATLVGASVDAADLAARMEELARAIEAFEPDTAAGTAPTSTPRPVLHAVPTQSDAAFVTEVQRLKGAIEAGDVYQVVPSRGFTLPLPRRPDRLPPPARVQPQSLHVLRRRPRLRAVRRLPRVGAAALGRHRRGDHPHHRRYPPAGPEPGRLGGPRARHAPGAGAAHRRQGGRRTRHARGPGAQRRRPRQRAGHTPGRRPAARGPLQPGHAPGLGGPRAARPGAGRPGRLPPAATVLAALEPTANETAAGRRPALCLSPGPGHPRSSGCLMELVTAALERGIPTVGICLGFQATVEACGGRVERVGPVHGRSVRVTVTAEGRADPAFEVLAGGPLEMARYHSLGTRELPGPLACLARTEDGIVMAARHRNRPVVGLQFHPESLLPPHGPGILLLRNLIRR